MKKLLLALLSFGLVSALPAPAQTQVLQGKVYQVEFSDIYVEAPDHTAVRVPVNQASFYVHGTPMDYTDLQIGMPVTVHYRPLAGPVIYAPSVVFGASTPETPGYFTRDTYENGMLIHHVWSGGHWHRE